MIEKNNIIFLDSNSFYYFCDYIGSKSNVENVKGNNSVNYTLLHDAFSEMIEKKTKVISLSPTVLLETIVHFKTRPLDLDTMYKTFAEFWIKKRFELGNQEYGPIFQGSEKGKLEIFNSVLIEHLKPSAFIEKCLVEKANSEATLTVTFVYIVFIVFLFMFFKINESEMESVMSDFGNDFINSYETVLKPDLFKIVKKDILSAYSDGTEGKVIQSHFDNYLKICFNHSISLIENNLSDNKKIDLLLPHLKACNKSCSKKMRRWYLDVVKSLFIEEDGKKRKVIDIVFDSIETGIICKGYSVGQYNYLKSKIYDFYNKGSLIEKNDTEDFWMMFLNSRGLILTFDDYLRGIIRQTDPTNADYINGLSTKNI